MKNIKKFIALMLVFAVCTLIFASCGNHKEKAIASFGDSYIYEDDKDFSDFYHLFTYQYKIDSYETEISDFEHNIILREAVNTTVEMRLLEDETARRGYYVDMAKVEEEALEDKEILDKAYEGGFAAFCAQWGVSEDAFITYNKYEALQELAKENFFIMKNVKDEEALEYYEEHKDEFIKEPHYEIKELFLQVTEDTNKLAVCNDAIVYITMLNLGKSWDYVLEYSQKKYNLKNGMIFSHYLSGTEIIEKVDVVKYGSVNNEMNEIAENFKKKYGYYYEDMFPEGFEEHIKKNNIEVGSVTYKRLFEAHMTYCSEVYSFKRNYAIMEKWQTGNAYYLPIYHGGFESYVVVYFDYIENEEGTVSFEDAKEEIIERITEERKEKNFEDFISRKVNEVDVQIRY